MTFHAISWWKNWNSLLYCFALKSKIFKIKLVILTFQCEFLCGDRWYQNAGPRVSLEAPPPHLKPPSNVLRAYPICESGHPFYFPILKKLQMLSAHRNGWLRCNTSRMWTVFGRDLLPDLLHFKKKKWAQWCTPVWPSRSQWGQRGSRLWNCWRRASPSMSSLRLWGTLPNSCPLGPIQILVVMALIIGVRVSMWLVGLLAMVDLWTFLNVSISVLKFSQPCLKPSLVWFWLWHYCAAKCRW